MLIDTLIVVPLKSEAKLLISELEALGHKGNTENLSHMGIKVFPSLKLKIGVTGHGKTQSGIQTQYLLQAISGIKKLIGVGSAGALTEGTRVGDLVISKSTVEHDYLEKFAPGPLPSFPGSPQLIEIAGRVRNSEFSIHLGNIASGDEDIVDFQRATEIFQKTKALAVAWEGAGWARAARLMNISHLEVRSITDHANKATPIDFQNNLNIAMKNLARFLTAMAPEK